MEYLIQSKEKLPSIQPTPNISNTRELTTTGKTSKRKGYRDKRKSVQEGIYINQPDITS